MLSLKLRKVVAAATVAASVLALSPIGASAEWRQDSNGWWNTEGNSYSVGWSSIGNTWYYFDADGYMKTGWVNDGGTWYYLESSGAMKTGWVKDGSTWYYLQSSGAMQTGWVKDGSTWYYLQSSGAMKTGWINDNGVWYFAASSGAMQTGVVQVDGKIYYLAASGAMQTGSVTINGVTYTFAASGEAIGNVLPTPTLSFTSAGVSAPVDTTTGTGTSTGTDTSSSGSGSNGGGGGGGGHHSGGGSTNDVDITPIVSGLYADKINSIFENHPTLKNDISVDLTANPIQVTLKNSNLDSLQTVFETSKNEDLSVIEARLTKAEEVMVANSAMLSIDGLSLTDYLAKADANYVANGGNSDYFVDGSFNTPAIAEKIKNSTLTYDQFKQNLQDRIGEVVDKTNNPPTVTISAGSIKETVTKMEVDGKTLYDASLPIETNIKGLVSLGDTTTGTYKIHFGSSYVTVNVSRSLG
ncbi:N-acetylmuramoyl-L-alanine amidase family protein [Clostridium sp. BL-8]|uniref:N-acetylmuramoyl-L-alanine amidase family protein n=1 Tax=Clostridium sp. BL-8 TaxID=349938 RepID=UPI00098C733F|nr:N-acetylmuramoyl-L-alanine amidase family protein [Clostridium sp. BL-8]OOM80342.1 autolysin [Clostridium sp. BL-8]